jgi:signal transduction histidine kinase
METKGLRLSHSCETDLKNVMADEILLREIIVNLIGNSFKFTQAGHINIEVFNRDNWVVMRIEDSGIGIAQNKQGLLFKRFQQAMERTLTREAGGTGLGLYISREFARKMNGDLRLVSSEVGKGSVFEIVLPGLK